MTELLHNPEPTFRVDGEAVGALTADALQLQIEESTLGLRTLQLHLVGEIDDDSVDHGLTWLDGSRLDFGVGLEVALGEEGEARTVFRGAISAIEVSLGEGRVAKVAVFAEDALMKLRMTRRARTFEEKTDAQIAEDLARAHGLEAEATAEGPRYDCVQQWNQSDLAFLRDRARLVEAEVWVEGDKLFFQQRGQRRGTQLTLTRGGDLMEVDVRADLAHQRARVAVSGFDARRRDKVDRDAGADALAAEVAEGRTGPSLVASVLGTDARPERGLTLRVRDNPQNDGEAEAWARAELLRRARGFVTAVGTTSGTPDLQVGSRLTLERVGRPFNGGDYYVTRFRHLWRRDEGFRTHFEAERPYVAGRSG